MYDPKRRPFFIPFVDADPKDGDMPFKPSDAIQIPHTHPKLIYICSPYDPSNMDKASDQMLNESTYAVFVVRRGCIPMTPHLSVSFLRCMPDQEMVDRAVECEHQMIHACDELWAFIEEGRDYGMFVEIQMATLLNKPVHFFNKDFQEVKL